MAGCLGAWRVGKTATLAGKDRSLISSEVIDLNVLVAREVCVADDWATGLGRHKIVVGGVVGGLLFVYGAMWFVVVGLLLLVRLVVWLLLLLGFSGFLMGFEILLDIVGVNKFGFGGNLKVL